MGKARKRLLSRAGGAIEKPNQPVDEQMEEGKIVKKKRVQFVEDGADDDEKLTTQLGPKQLSAVLKQAQIQSKEFDSEEEDAEVFKKLDLSKKTLLDDENADISDDDNDGKIEFDPDEYKVDPKDEKDFEKFVQLSGEKTIYDLIMEKLEERKRANMLGPSAEPEYSLPKEAVHLYRELGKVLSYYRSGKVPLAFKTLPTLVNWEEIIEFTNPEGWSSATMLYAVRMFSKTQKVARVQRFYNTILLPRVRDEIAAHKKLNPHLYEALFKAAYKPAAFYKGIVLPLAESGNCTLTESVIIGSVIAKKHIPAIHSCAALYKLGSISGINFASGLYFLHILIKKRYALPYQVVDKLVEYFVQTASSNDELPLLWHRSLLMFVEDYANDLSPEQMILLSLTIKNRQNHYYYTPQIISRLKEAEEKLEKGDVVMKE